MNALKKQRRYYSGKQKCHTLKAQILVHQPTQQILATAFGTGRRHDFRLYKATNIRVHPEVELLADKGYQGILKHHANSTTPHRKPRNGQLSKEQRQHNRALAKRRIVIEQTNRRLKVWRIFSGRYRNRRRRFALRINLIAAILNFELALHSPRFMQEV